MLDSIWFLCSLCSIIYTALHLLNKVHRSKVMVEAPPQANEESSRNSGLLPLPTQNLILRNLSPLDRHRYSLASRQAHFAVASFNRQAYRIEHILSPYFSEQEIDLFRLIQLKTGTLISGSTALQFFDLSVYEDSDLDLYILRDWDKVMQLAGFLISVSYEYKPRPEQARSLQQAFEAGSSNVPVPHLDPEYSSRDIWDVYSFVKASNGKKIQIITCKRNIMEVILGFHSTCVMNVISYTHAYSLYPYATFLDRRTVVISPVKSNRLRAFAKYAERGWRTAFIPSKNDAMRSRSEFRDTARCVGDSSCWIIALAPVQHTLSLGNSGNVSPSVDPVRANSWYTILTEAGQTQIGFQVLTTSPDERNRNMVHSFTFPSIPYKLRNDYSTLLLGESPERFTGQRSTDGIVRLIHAEFDAEPDAIAEYARKLVFEALVSMPVFLNLEGKRLSPTLYSSVMLVRQLQVTFTMFRQDPHCSITFRIDSSGQIWSFVVITLPPNHPRHLITALRNSIDNFTLKHLMQHRVWITFFNGTHELDLWHSRARDSSANYRGGS